MKLSHVVTVCIAILCGVGGYAFAQRYQVSGHPFGPGSTILKVDKWTGAAWRLDTRANVWMPTYTELPPAANPFDQIAATETPQLTANDMDALASAFEKQGAAELAKLSRQRAQEMRGKGGKN